MGLATIVGGMTILAGVADLAQSHFTGQSYGVHLFQAVETATQGRSYIRAEDMQLMGYFIDSVSVAFGGLITACGIEMDSVKSFAKDYCSVPETVK